MDPTPRLGPAQIGVLAQLIVSTVLLGGIYALISVGLTLIFGIMRVVNFAHGEFLMLGMYLAFWAFLVFTADPYFVVFVAIPLFFLVGLAVYALTRPSSASAQATTSSTRPRTTTNPDLGGLTIPSGLTLTSADVDMLRGILKGTNATAAVADIYGASDASARLRFAQVIINRMAVDHKPAYETVETVLQEFYS